LKGTKITSNSLHPGNISTEISRHVLPEGYPILTKLKDLVLRSAEVGSDTSVYLAGAQEVDGLSGKYWMECEPFAPSAQASDRDAARKLWEISEHYVQKYLK